VSSPDAAVPLRIASPSALPAARLRKAQLSRSLRYSLWEGLVAMPAVTIVLPAGVFLTALATKGLPLSKTAIGALTAMPSAANFLQLFVTPVVHRYSPRKLAVLGAAAQAVCWLALVPMLVSLPAATAGAWLTGWYFVMSLFGSVSSVAWNAWIDDWVPSRIRGKFFGRRNRLIQVATILFLLPLGWALSHWHYSLPVFQGIILVALSLRIISLRLTWITPARSFRRRTPIVRPAREQLALVRGSQSLMWFVAFGAVWQFAANCFGAFYPVFLFEQMDFSAFEVGILATVSSVGGALSMPAWGRLIDRHGSRPVMVFSLVAWQLQNFLWCFLEPHSRTLVYVLCAWGGLASVGAIASAGFVLGQFTMLLRLIPEEARSVAIALNLAITSLAAAVAPVVGGYAISWALDRGPDPLAVYHACFVVQPVLALANCFLLLRVREPQASTLTTMFGTMRSIRTLSSILGLSFLTHYLFIKPRSGGSDRRADPPP
jgi:MFS family permease